VDEIEETGGGAAARAATEDTVRAAGRGGLALTGAKVSFIIFGFAQQFILPRLLPVEGYGQVSLVLGIVSILNNVIVAASIQGVSRAVATAPEDRAGDAFRATLRIHLILAMTASLLFALAAGAIADFERAPHLTAPLRLSAAVVLLYGVYAPMVGSLNGRRRFLDQAGLDVGYGALRTLAILGGAFVFTLAGGDGVIGAFAGFVTAAAVIVPMALARAGTGSAPAPGAEPTPGTRWDDYFLFLLPLVAGQGCLNLLLQLDAILLRRFAGQAASSSVIADALQGVYRSVQLFSFLPYQMLMPITFILFPMLARAQADGDREAVRRYTMTGVRLALLLTALMVGAISATAPHLLRFAYPGDVYWTQGGGALRILSLGMGSFCVLGIICAALTSLGRPLASFALTATSAALVALACRILVPQAEVGPPMLVASATAASVALTAAAIAGAVVLYRTAGGFAAPATLLRVAVALGISIAVGSRLPWLGKLVAPVEAAGVGLLGLGVLIVLGEVGREDLARVMQVVRRKR
jgi:stage V sporulation protein B